MRTIRFLGGSLLAMAIVAGCSEISQPVALDTTLDAARSGIACQVTDDPASQVRTISVGCVNSSVSVPAGWTLQVRGARTGGVALNRVSPTAITQFENPTPEYIAATDLIDISGAADFTIHPSITDGTQTVTFSVPMEKRSVPGSWGTWASPPFVEPGMPHILYTQGAQALTMTLALPSTIFGFELGPNPFAFHTFTAEFFSGAELVGSITREISGDAGARLIAAQTQGASFDRVVVTGTADFSIGRVRYSAGPPPPPPSPVDIHAVFSGPPNRDPNQIHLADPSVFVQILNIEQYLPRSASPSDVRIGPSFGAGTPAQNFEILDLNADGNRDIQLRFSTAALIAAGHLGPGTEQIVVWGRDQTTGDMYRGEARVQIIGAPPEPTIDQNQPDASVYMAGFSQTDLAQSFQTQQGLLPTVGAGIFLQPGVGGTDNVRISLWTALPNAGGTMLAQGQTMGTQGQWVDIIFDTPVLLTPNTTYYLVFDGNLSLGIAGSTANPYPHGHVFANPGFSPFPNFDYTFRTWIAPAGGASLSPGHLDRMKTMFPSGSVSPSRSAPATRTN
jgi:hypothetical protein